MAPVYSTGSLLFSKQIVPQLQAIPYSQAPNYLRGQIQDAPKTATKGSETTLALTEIIKGLTDVAKEYRPLALPSSQTGVTREAPPALQDKVRPSLLSRTVSSVKRAFTRKKITTDTLASPPSLAEVANAYKTPVEQKSIGIERTPATEAVRKVIEYEDVATSPYIPDHNYRDLTQAELKKLYMYIHTNNPGIIEAPPTGRQPSFYTDKNLRKVIKASKFVENTTGQALDEIIGGGKYTNDGDGLYSNEIQQILKDRTHRVIPVIASDPRVTRFPAFTH